MCMERSMNRGKRSLEEEKSMTDLEREKLLKKDIINL